MYLLEFFYRNFNLLSFGEEAEEDEEMVNQVSQVAFCPMRWFLHEVFIYWCENEQ